MIVKIKLCLSVSMLLSLLGMTASQSPYPLYSPAPLYRSVLMPAVIVTPVMVPTVVPDYVVNLGGSLLDLTTPFSVIDTYHQNIPLLSLLSLDKIIGGFKIPRTGHSGYVGSLGYIDHTLELYTIINDNNIFKTFPLTDPQLIEYIATQFKTINEQHGDGIELTRIKAIQNLYKKMWAHGFNPESIVRSYNPSPASPVAFNTTLPITQEDDREIGREKLQRLLLNIQPVNTTPLAEVVQQEIQIQTNFDQSLTPDITAPESTVNEPEITKEIIKDTIPQALETVQYPTLESTTEPKSVSGKIKSTGSKKPRSKKNPVKVTTSPSISSEKPGEPEQFLDSAATAVDATPEMLHTITCQEFNGPKDTDSISIVSPSVSVEKTITTMSPTGLSSLAQELKPVITAPLSEVVHTTTKTKKTNQSEKSKAAAKAQQEDAALEKALKENKKFLEEQAKKILVISKLMQGWHEQAVQYQLINSDTTNFRIDLTRRMKQNYHEAYINFENFKGTDKQRTIEEILYKRSLLELLLWTQNMQQSFILKDIKGSLDWNYFFDTKNKTLKIKTAGDLIKYYDDLASSIDPSHKGSSLFNIPAATQTAAEPALPAGAHHPHPSIVMKDGSRMGFKMAPNGSYYAIVYKVKEGTDNQPN